MFVEYPENLGIRIFTEPESDYNASVSTFALYSRLELINLGTPDLVAEIAGKLSLVDYKPETAAKRTVVQTAAYMVMLLANQVKVRDRYELRLHSDGTYRLRQHQDDDDLKRWAAMASGYHAHTHYL